MSDVTSLFSYHTLVREVDIYGEDTIESRAGQETNLLRGYFQRRLND